MSRIFTSVAVAILASVVPALSQGGNPFKSAASVTSGVEYYLTNFGILGYKVSASTPGFFYPRGGPSYLYGSGLWFGAQKRHNDTLRRLTFITYNPNSGASYATPGNTDSANRDQNLYYSGNYDRASGVYVGSGTSATVWPLWMKSGAGSATIDNPGTYEPIMLLRQSGTTYERPAFMPNVSEQFVTRFNDQDLSRYEGLGREFGFPLSLQVQQSVYSFAEGLYESTVVVQYEIVNTSSDTLVDCVVAQASDPDIGMASNDRIASLAAADGRIRVGMAYSPDENMVEFGALAQVLLEAPAVNAQGFIDNSLRASLIREHEIGAFPSWTLESDPRTTSERYDFMSEGGRTGETPAGDVRTLLASKKFSMMPGDTAHFAMAYSIVAPVVGRTRGEGLPALQNAGPTLDVRTLIAALVSDFEDGVFNSQSSAAVRDDAMYLSALSARPNPASDASTVEFSMESRGDVTVSVVNALGERVETTALGELDPGAHRVRIDTRALPVGSYLVVVDAGGARRTMMLTVGR